MSAVEPSAQQAQQVRTTEVEKTVAVETTVTDLADNDPDALERVIVNNGAYDVYIGLQPTIAINQGTRLGANGGTVTYQRPYDFDLTGRKLYAIAETGASDVYVLTVRKQ